MCSLGENKIDAEGALAIVTALASNTTLTDLLYVATDLSDGVISCQA